MENCQEDVSVVDTVTLVELGLLFNLLNRAGMTQIETRFCMEIQDRLRAWVATEQLKQQPKETPPATTS